MKKRFRFNSAFDLRIRKTIPAKDSILTEGILASNLDTSTPDNIRIALWNEWRAMLEDLHGIGPVWSIVRNGHCVLAVEGVYPKLTFSSDQQSASACDGDRSLTCHFSAWRQAVAFDSNCSCGRTRGLEFRSVLDEIFHRVCLSKGNDLTPFAEWIQMHQATGLETEELDEETDFYAEEPFFPTSAAIPPGTLQFPPHLLRTVLITAAQREISLIAGVSNEGISQTARIDILQASEAHGWLVLSGNQRSFYVESEPTGSLFLERGSIEGETLWRLSLVDPDGHHLMRLQGGTDSRSNWNQLIREVVLSSSSVDPD